MVVADVILPLGVEEVFSYWVPDTLVASVAAGRLVIVPFRKQSWYTGVVYAVREEETMKEGTKAVEYVVGEEFSLSPEHLKFLTWMSKYYMTPLGNVVRAALPIVMRMESGTHLRLAERWASEEARSEIVTPQEESIVQYFTRLWQKRLSYVDLPEVEANDLYVYLYNHRVKDFSAIYSLIRKGVLELQESRYQTYKPKWEKYVTWNRPFSETELHEVLDSLKRAKSQYALLCNWIDFCTRNDTDTLSRKEFTSLISPSTAALKAMCERAILKIVSLESSRLDMEVGELEEVHALSPVQETAMKTIQEAFQEKDCVLLQGVTSSGKTEIYIHLIQQALAEGKQVLYLLPEIGLTVQLVKRLRRVFGRQVSIYHSGMSDNARAELWQRQHGHEPFPIVLGVRSSIFLPFQRLGLVIVDEEHDPSYKQQEPAPRYNGRDAAIMLAKMTGAKVLLGSATPSFESYRNAQEGKYGFVTLTQRYGGVQMPELMFVDMKEYRRKKLMKEHFTPVLVDEMNHVLENGGQVILFHNRRGYSTYVQCDTCGAILKCKHCDVSLTLHGLNGQLQCHYCGRWSKAPAVCESCGKGHYVYTTPPGTERIEEETQRLFPNARVARVDTDVMSNRAQFKKILENFEARKIDILVGTQMVSKGLDFEGVKLVGILDASTLMGFSDFRAEERAYDMLTQVSGRCGRRDERGKVVIQVMDRHNRIYGWAEREDFDEVFTTLCEERKLFRYPPFYRLILIELRHRESERLREVANELTKAYREKLGNRVCGPAEPAVKRINQLYRLQIWIKIEPEISLSSLKVFLEKTHNELSRKGLIRGVLLHFDVDPL